MISKEGKSVFINSLISFYRELHFKQIFFSVLAWWRKGGIGGVLERLRLVWTLVLQADARFRLSPLTIVFPAQRA